MYKVLVSSCQEQMRHLSSLRCGIPTAIKPLRTCEGNRCCTCSDLLLECSNCEGLHNRLCWLCLDLPLLAEDHPHACFGGWLDPGLDAADAWNCEDACLLHLLRGNSRESAQDVGAVLGLHLILSCQQLQQGTLCHDLRAACLHSLHGLLHGSHVHNGRGIKEQVQAKSLLEVL